MRPLQVSVCLLFFVVCEGENQERAKKTKLIEVQKRKKGQTQLRKVKLKLKDRVLNRVNRHTHTQRNGHVFEVLLVPSSFAAQMCNI